MTGETSHGKKGPVEIGTSINEKECFSVLFLAHGIPQKEKDRPCGLGVYVVVNLYHYELHVNPRVPFLEKDFPIILALQKLKFLHAPR
jgi:hypothetical protein